MDGPVVEIQRKFGNLSPKRNRAQSGDFGRHVGFRSDFWMKGKALRFEEMADMWSSKATKASLGHSPRTSSMWSKRARQTVVCLAGVMARREAVGNFTLKMVSSSSMRATQAWLARLLSTTVNQRLVTAVLPSGFGSFGLCAFVDGSLETVSVNPVNGVTLNTQAQDDLMIGSNPSGNHFNGVVDDLRIYSRVFPPIEVQSIALDGTIRFTTASVLVRLKWKS